MHRWVFSVSSGTIAFFPALSLVSDPVAFIAGASQSAGIAAQAQTAPVTPLSAHDCEQHEIGNLK
jgi:hypothetical protein